MEEVEVLRAKISSAKIEIESLKRVIEYKDETMEGLIRKIERDKRQKRSEGMSEQPEGFLGGRFGEDRT